MILSIVMPAFNESRTIHAILNRVMEVQLIAGIQKQIIIVNDASTDDTETLVLDFASSHPEIDIIYKKHEVNQGKGAAIHTGIKLATGDYIIVQDADLEYDPEDYNDLLAPILRGEADVVYGSRFITNKPRRVFNFHHYLANIFLD